MMLTVDRLVCSEFYMELMWDETTDFIFLNFISIDVLRTIVT